MQEYLVCSLYGPLCSWGDIAVGEVRPSTMHPAKSAVLGLLAAALGLKRPDTAPEETERTALEAAHRAMAHGYGYAVRVDAPGTPLVDYHTIQVPPSGSGRNRRHFATRRDELTTLPRSDLATILSRREYRVDAYYTLALWPRAAVPYPLTVLAARLQEPTFPLYLGRKSCPLALPLAPRVVMADSIIAAMAQAQGRDDFLQPLLSPATRPALYWDEDGEAGIPMEHTFTRRDAVHSRHRWQFMPRSERHGVLPPQEASDV